MWKTACSNGAESTPNMKHYQYLGRFSHPKKRQTKNNEVGEESHCNQSLTAEWEKKKITATDHSASESAGTPVDPLPHLHPHLLHRSSPVG